MSPTPLQMAITAIALSLSALFTFSAATKLGSLESSMQMVRELGAKTLLVQVSAVALLTAGELLTGVIMLVPNLHVLAGISTALCGTVFGASGVFVLVRGDPVKCACFGGHGRALGGLQVVQMPFFWAAGGGLIAYGPQWDARDAFRIYAAVCCLLCLTQTVMCLRAIRLGASDRLALLPNTRAVDKRTPETLEALS